MFDEQDESDGLPTVHTVGRPVARATGVAIQPSAGVEGKAVELVEGQRLLLGSGPACDVRLEGRSVSRRHAALSIEDGKLLLTDLASANGTRIGSLRVREAVIEDACEVRIGDHALVVTPLSGRTASAGGAAETFGRVVASSPEMRRLFATLRKLSGSRLPLVIEGETGTGKEALAEAIHEEGERSRGPFVVFDCTTVAPTLVESELFGHEKGAFTGATAARQGVFEAAHGGTLLIDEIGDLPLPLQAKLLRVIERGEVRRVGGNRVLTPDVRVLAATRRDLDREVAEGRFRDDLYHRLSVVRVELPPLRKRRADIPLLAAHFARSLGVVRLPAELVATWTRAPWPGNVRELRNAVARWQAMGAEEAPAASSTDDDETVAAVATGAEVPDVFAALLAKKLPWTQARAELLEAFRGRYLEEVLRAHGGNVTRAAAASGLALRYFQLLRQRG